MNKSCTQAGWVASIFFLASLATAEPPPAAAFASLPEMAMVCMTPDGQKVAWANDPGGKPVIIIFDLAKFSPARAINSIRAPILLVHAADDTVVPFSQTEYFAKLLGDKGKDYKLIKLAGEDHWLSTSSSRLTILQAVEEFLAKNLK